MKILLSIWVVFTLLFVALGISPIGGSSVKVNDVSIYIDTTETETIDTVIKRSDFTPIHGNMISKNANVVWLKINLNNLNLSFDKPLVLFSGSTEMIKSMRAYAKSSDEYFNLGICKPTLDEDSCGLPNLQYAFKISNSTKVIDSILLRLESGGTAIQNDFFVMSTSHYNKVNVFLNYFLGFSTGISLIVGGLCFFVFVVFRNPALLYLGLYSVTAFLLTNIYRGIWDAMIPPDFVLAANIFLYVLFASRIFECIFIAYFFNTRQNHPVINKVIKLEIGVLLFLSVLNLFPSMRQDIWNILPLVLLVSSAVFLVILVAFLIKKIPSSLLFLIAWSPGLISYVVWGAYFSGLLYDHWGLGYAPMFFRPLQLFLLSYLIFVKVKDIYDENQMTRANEHHNTVIRTLLRTLSHDLSNTTSNIYINAELAVSKGADGEILKYLERIIKAANSQISIIQYAKKSYIRRGESNSSVSMEEVDLVKCIEEAVDCVKYKAETKKVTINYQFDQNYKVCAEAVSLTHHVLLNLLDNAIKFTPSGKNIFISLSSQADGIVNIKIKDEGIGMPEPFRTKLWDNQESISRMGTSNEVGTGHGLVIVHDFIKVFGV